MTKTNYLTNKQLLGEIHRCKTSFCSYLEPRYGFFDAIVDSTDAITPEKITETFEAKKAILAKAKESTEGITEADVVFRVMTYEHIPDNTDPKKKTRGANQDKMRVNFPPFKHYIMRDGELVEVGRSHWTGGFANGYFDMENGRLTNRMGYMMKLLVERVGFKRNWRGYCVDDQTEALTKRGWLRHDEINETDEVISLDGDRLVWSPLKSIYRDHSYDGAMHRLTVKGFDALVTPNHKFVTTEGIKTVEDLRQKDRIILTGKAVESSETIYSDELVELLGWIYTEGNYHQPADRDYIRVCLYQNEGPHAERIRKCLRALSDGHGESNTKKCIAFTLRKELCELVTTTLPDRQLTPEFLLALSTQQRELLFETIIAGDGWDRAGGNISFAQKCEKRVDSFAMLAALIGRRTATKIVTNDAYGNGTPQDCHIVNVFSAKHDFARVENIDFAGGKADGRTQDVHRATEAYKGTVWCVETLYGSFFVRRNGYTYLTGNSYNEDMQSQALVHLCQVALLFDESKGSNPFAFYTQVITYCFLRILLLEKRVQEIRDDLLVEAGVAPSMSRQIDDELSQNPEFSKFKKLPAKRGRKAAGVVAAIAKSDENIE